MSNLSGSRLGQYQVDDRLGSGDGTVVYRALEHPLERQVALKLLDPRLTDQRGFLERFVEQLATINALDHPRVVPVYEVATRTGVTYLSMRLYRGGALAQQLALGPPDLHTALRILHDIAGALHSAHEAGVVHGNLKPSNVLIDTDGSAHVVDFGLSRLGGRPDAGTLAHLAPEQMLGRPADARTDVHGLALLLLEMVTGDRLRPRAEAAIDPGQWRALTLPPGLESVLRLALARSPDERPQTVDELLDLLAPIPWGAPPAGLADAQLRVLLEAALDPALAIDGAARVVHWNRRAGRLLGWDAELMVGRPLLETVVAPRHREMFERILATVVAGTSPLPDGRTLEVLAINRDGSTLPLEVSISRLRLGSGAVGAVLFCRDASARDASARQEAEAGAVPALRPPEPDLAATLARACTDLGLGAAAVWVRTDDRSRVHCEAFWSEPEIAAGELRMLSQGVQQPAHLGMVGRTMTSGQAAWGVKPTAPHPSRRDRAAERAGLRGTGAVPIHDAGDVALGSFEYFTFGDRPPPPRPELEELADQLVPILRRPRPDGGPRLLRFALDRDSTVLGFSCALMKLLTVHGVFRDFSGWVEIEGEDPATVRAECVIKAASVSTGGLDRDYHLRSPDFFDVENYPDIAFRVTRVGPLGDQRFRVLGELRIRDVTRAVRLDARLEDADGDASQVRRLTLTASTVIDRLDWFLDWERALQAGRWIVGDQVRLELV
ncbi:MAG: YceI family protein, partial [Candidatus Dormiibacterota bacterium]